MERKPVIFTNKAIDKIEDDAFGLKEYIDSVNKAVKNSKMIGIIGEFGSGKTSLVNLLNADIYDKRVISFLHYIEVDSKKKKEKYDAKDLLKILIYNLSNSNKKDFLSKVLSNNFGELSISSKSKEYLCYLGLSIVIAIVVKLTNFYFEMTNISNFANINLMFFILYQFIFIINSIDKYLPYLITVINLYGLMKSKVVFSLWDSQGKRRIGEEELISLCEEVVEEIEEENIKVSKKENKKEYKRNLIIIEDLDRIDDEIILEDFIKLMYKVSTKECLSSTTFILSLNKTDKFHRIDHERILFDKVFDYQIELKKIHRVDYKDYVLKLLKGNIESNEYQRYFRNNLEKFPSELTPIISGDKVNFREIKKRLNATFLLFNHLKQNENNNYISLESCSYIAYLEGEYPKQMKVLTKNESNFDQFEVNIKKGYYSIGYDDIKDIEEKFKNEVNKLLQTYKFGVSPRIYFYRYPSNSFVPNQDQGELIKNLSDSTHNGLGLRDLIDKVLNNQEGYLLIYEHLEFLIGNDLLPFNIIHNNIRILEICVSINRSKVLDLSKNQFHLNDTTFNFEIDWYNRIFETNNEQLINFLFDFISIMVNQNILSSTKISLENFIKIRIGLNSIISSNIDMIYLFYGKYFPIITEDELQIFVENNKINEMLRAVNIDLIARANISYFFPYLNRFFSDVDLGFAKNIYDKILIVNQAINNESLLGFLTQNNILDAKYQDLVSINIKESELTTQLDEYLTLLLMNKIDLSISLLTQVVNIGLTINTNTNLIVQLIKNGFYGHSMRIIIVNDLYELIDFANENDLSNTLRGLEQLKNSDPELIIEFRIHIIKNVKKAISIFKIIFGKSYPMLRIDEYNYIKNLRDLNIIFDFENVDTKIIGNIISKINTIHIDVNSAKSFINRFHNYVINFYIKNNSTVSLYINKIKFKRFYLQRLDIETLNKLFDSFYVCKGISKSSDKLDVMLLLDLYDIRLFKNTVELNSVEKMQLVKLISTCSDNFSKISMYFKEYYIDGILNDVIIDELSKVDDIKNVVSSKILKNQNHYHEYSFEIYLNLFRNTQNVSKILLKNDDFINELISNNLINDLNRFTYDNLFSLILNNLTFEYVLNRFGIGDNLYNLITNMKLQKNSQSKLVDQVIELYNQQKVDSQIVKSVYLKIDSAQKSRITKKIGKDFLK